MRLVSLLVSLLLISLLAEAQSRIDSSFAFSTNPAKEYSIYIPSNFNPANANAMVVAFHPLNLARWNSESWCDTLIAFSEANDVITVCPDGGANGDVTDPIDYGFTSALIDSMKTWYNIDSQRVYALGFSMGGKAVYEYGLSNADIFGGYIPIGAAVSGAGFLSGTIQNAAAKPFYLVHGSLDATSTRFYPLITALKSNCALVDSNLMTGVGHTIDFPNRNAILGDAYQWVDSVNITPRTGIFSLTDPANLSTLVIRGFHDYVHNFKWEESPLQDSCGSLTYEVLVDLPNGTFVNPLLVMPSNNNGMDTVLSLTNHDIDSLLASYSIPLNGSLALDWTVRTNINNKYSDTAKEYRITFTRKKLGFDLLTPANNNTVNLVNNNSKFFDWEDLNHYIGFKYYVLLDDTAGDFSNPIAKYESSGNGATSSGNYSREFLYYDLMFLDGYKIDDTLALKWKVLADDTTYTEYSASERNITLIRKEVGFALISIPDESLINSKKGTEYTLRWDSVPLPDITYEVRFDTLNADLSQASFLLGSDNDSLDARRLVRFEDLDSLMDFYNVSYLDTIHGHWTVRAIHADGEEYSLTTYKLSIVRAHPVGIIESEELSKLRFYPNPTKNILTIENNDLICDRIRIYDNQSILVLEQPMYNKNKISLDLSFLNSGNYFIEFLGENTRRSEKLLIIR